MLLHFDYVKKIKGKHGFTNVFDSAWDWITKSVCVGWTNVLLVAFKDVSKICPAYINKMFRPAENKRWAQKIVDVNTNALFKELV